MDIQKSAKKSRSNPSSSHSPQPQAVPPQIMAPVNNQTPNPKNTTRGAKTPKSTTATPSVVSVASKVTTQSAHGSAPTTNVVPPQHRRVLLAGPPGIPSPFVVKLPKVDTCLPHGPIMAKNDSPQLKPVAAISPVESVKAPTLSINSKGKQKQTPEAPASASTSSTQPKEEKEKVVCRNFLSKKCRNAVCPRLHPVKAPAQPVLGTKTTTPGSIPSDDTTKMSANDIPNPSGKKKTKTKDVPSSNQTGTAAGATGREPAEVIVVTKGGENKVNCSAGNNELSTSSKTIVGEPEKTLKTSGDYKNKKPREICRKYLANRCKKPECPRIHQQVEPVIVAVPIVTTRTPTTDAEVSIPASLGNRPLLAKPVHVIEPTQALAKNTPVCKNFVFTVCESSPGERSHSKPIEQEPLTEHGSDSSTQASGSNYSTDRSSPEPTSQSDIPDEPSRPGSPSLSVAEPPLLRPYEHSFAATILDHTKVEFGPGFEIQRILTGFESHWIVLDNILANTGLTALTRIVEPFGTVKEIRPMSKVGCRTMSVKVRFKLPSEATAALSALNGSIVLGRRISVRLPVNTTRGGNGIMSDTSIRITFDSPHRVGFAGYSSLAEAHTAIVVADGQIYGGMFTTASLYRGVPALDAFNVRFTLPTSMTLAEFRIWCSSSNVTMEKPNYMSLEFVTSLIRETLSRTGHLSFDVPLGPHREQVNATAHYESAIMAKAACEYLREQRYPFLGPRSRLVAQWDQHISYRLARHAFHKIAQDVNALRLAIMARGHQTSILIHANRRPFDRPVIVKLLGESTSELGVLKAEFEKCLHGEIVRQKDGCGWDVYFGRAEGANFLRDLRRKLPSVSIQTCLVTRKITLFGPPVPRQTIRNDILRRLAVLKGQQIRTIPLSSSLFIRLFVSSEMNDLQRRLGPKNIQLDSGGDSGGRSIIIRGGDETYRLAWQVIERVRAAEQTCRDDECPICLNGMTSPVKLDCGHSCCSNCLKTYLTAATENTSFPLVCYGAGATCNTPIPLKFAQEHLSSVQLEAVAYAAYYHHVHSNPREFAHCPTPDCPQIYRQGPEGTVLQCPACLARICPSCRIEYHEGRSCDEVDISGTRMFKVWTSSRPNDVKSCPGCSTVIEKNEGCNHMCCTHCHTHICWLCLETFPRGDGIYDHMRTMHGGIGV